MSEMKTEKSKKTECNSNRIMDGTIYGMLTGILIGTLFGWCLGFSMSRNKMRQEAIDHHAAYYSTTNLMDGISVFQWNDQFRNALPPTRIK